MQGSDGSRTNEPKPDGTSAGPLRLTPSVRAGSIPMLPRTLVVAVIVGVAAFVAGALLGNGKAPVPPIANASPAVTPALVRPSPSIESVAPDEGGLKPLVRVSSFAIGFDPGGLISNLPGGTTCVTEETSGPFAGPFLIRTWVATCPTKGLPTNFDSQLLRAIMEAIPELAGSGAGPDASGMATQAFEYNAEASAGTITITSTQHQDTLVLAITLAEAPLSSPGA